MESVLKVIFVGLLIAVSINDIKRMEIPNRLNLLIFLLGVVRLVVHLTVFVSVSDWLATKWIFWDPILGSLIVSVPLLLVAIFSKGAIGGGDVKLLAASGFYLGGRAVLRGSIFGFILAGVYAAVICVVRICAERSQQVGSVLKKEFPLGPFLCVGLAVVMYCYT